MAKGVKLTICQIRSIQAKVKYSIYAIFATWLEKITLFSKIRGRSVSTYAKSPTSDAQLTSEHTSEHSSQKQSTA